MTESVLTEGVRILGASALIAGLTYGAYADLRWREVSDRLWIVLGALGAVLGVVVESERGPLAVALWVVVSAFVLEHMIPWDVALERRAEGLPGILEVLLYVGVGGLLTAVGFLDGVGPSGLPLTVIAVYASVLFARLLFEVRILYGGADAKALMVGGVLVPLDATPLVALPVTATTILAIYPFTISLLMDAAIFSAGVPIYLALRNAARGEFEFPRGFTGYRLDVDDLADRFVWLRDPTFGGPSEEAEVETSEDDRALRRRQQAELKARGVTRVWVTPQLPFVVFLAAGTLAAVVLGNIVFDLAALL